ncbi:SDR family NAD(P)-dependent oxidoreductase [Myxococcota bacterium]|nr:SDR family NAD(P)-dependent oxidoreductase [Myxococcota bacterium]MBU1538111.1 SDR family NAD(P)-dependent oxidoreductase [Myxococcota bacterium]
MEKRALITGASSGIGLAFAHALAQEGYSLVLVSRRGELLESIALSLLGTHRTLAADLTQDEDIERVARLLEQEHFDLLINNAGFGKYGMFHETALPLHQEVVQLNVGSLVALSHAFLKCARSGDALINVSSVLSRLTYPGGAVYAATKGFVTVFTESLWYENRERGVYVTALLPGATRTGFHLIATGSIRTSFKERAMSYSPEVIVAEALRMLRERKKPSLVSGPRFRWLAHVLSRFAPRAGMIAFMGRQSPGLKKGPH